MNNTEQIKVIFPIEQYKKWRAYIDAVRTEISGFGKVMHVERNTFIITDLMLFEQVVSGGHTNITEESYGNFHDELIKRGEKSSAWRLWWHSHAFIDSYFSSIDAATIEDYDLESDKNNWLLSIVSNKRHETKIRLDIFRPVRITVEDISFEISYADYELECLVQEEVERKVTIFRPKPRPPYVPPIITPPSTTASAATLEHPLLPAPRQNPTIIMPDGREIEIDKN